jgi:hypothetical protein
LRRHIYYYYSKLKIATFFCLEDCLECSTKNDEIIIASINMDLLIHNNIYIYLLKCKSINKYFQILPTLTFEPRDNVTRYSNAGTGTLVDHVFSNLSNNSSIKILEANIYDHLSSDCII